MAETYAIYKSLSEPVFYMLPVAHVQVNGVNVGNLKSAIKRVINEEMKICVEVEKKLKKEDELKVERVIKSTQMAISKYIEPEYYLILAEYLNIKSEIREMVYNNYTPYFLYELINKKYMTMKFASYNAIDDELVNLRADLSPIKLQSAAEIADIVYSSLLNKEEWKSVLMSQINFINCKECIERYFYLLDKTTKYTFQNSNVELSRNYAKKMAEFSGNLFIHNLFVSKERNELLADRVIEFSKDDKCNVFIIGSAHFGGDYGLDKMVPNVKMIAIEY